jgi:hypothetical protein
MVKETGTAREIAAAAYIGEIPDINGSLNIKLAKNMILSSICFWFSRNQPVFSKSRRLYVGQMDACTFLQPISSKICRVKRNVKRSCHMICLHE